MAEVVYVLCALTSNACAVLLLRGSLASRTRLLFWGSFCFTGLALNNVLLYVDLVMTPPTVDLGILRSAVALRNTARPGYRAAIDSLTVGGRPATRYVLAPEKWGRWKALPEVR